MTSKTLFETVVTNVEKRLAAVNLKITPPLADDWQECIWEALKDEMAQRGYGPYATIEEALIHRHKGVWDGVTEAAADEQRDHKLPAAGDLSLYDG
jgi:hypothetical protein